MKKIILKNEVFETSLNIKVFNEPSNEKLIIVKDDINSFTVVADNHDIKIFNESAELVDETVNVLAVCNWDSNYYIVINETLNETLDHIKIHPLTLIQKVRNSNFLKSALLKTNVLSKNVSILPELVNLKDKHMIKECNLLLDAKLKLLALTNMSHLKDYVYIGLNNPIIWSGMTYDSIVEYIHHSDFRAGESYVVTNKKIAAIPTNAALICDNIELLQIYINEGRKYYDILYRNNLV